MPEDRIIGVAIDVGLIQEAWKRVEAKRLFNNPDVMDSFGKAISDAADTIWRMLRDWNLNKEEDQDAT